MESSGPLAEPSASGSAGEIARCGGDGGRGRLRAAGDVLFTGEKNQKPPGLVTQSVARPPDEPANVRRVINMTNGQDPAFRYAPAAR